jgi:putative endonuclease
MKQPAVYMMSNKRFGTIYTGVSSNLIKRVYEHKHAIIKRFTTRHNCRNLVYYEVYETMYDAITREKQLKGGSRKQKIDLIETMNPEWRDLYPNIT